MTVMVVGVVLATVLFLEDQWATDKKGAGGKPRAVTDELALLRQEVKDMHVKVTSARARLARSEKSKEVETADLMPNSSVTRRLIRGTFQRSLR